MKNYSELSIEESKEIGIRELMNGFGTCKRELIKQEILLNKLENDFRKEKEILEYKIENIHENIECIEEIMKNNMKNGLDGEEYTLC